MVYSKANFTALDHSEVTVSSAGKSNVINAQQMIRIAGGSMVTAQSQLAGAYPAVYGNEIAIDDAALSAKCTDHYAVYAVSRSRVRVKGDCDVTAYGGVYPGTGGLIRQPTNGEQLEVQAGQQTGGHENLDDRYAAQEILSNPMDYPYFQHAHPGPVGALRDPAQVHLPCVPK